MARTCRVGIHGRNNVTFDEVDYQVIRTAKIEAVKMMGQTKPEVFRRLKEDNPNIEIITRLYDDRFGVDTYPSPERFAEKQIPLMKALQLYCLKFEIHNEPNHLHRYEGWGQEDHHAQDFNNWFLRVYNLLKNACPWALLGFPGLAIPHRDLEWAEICRPAIERSDWLGVHCYWQTPAGQEQNHLVDFWGLRFKYYYEKFPHKIQEITECGNSNIQADPPISISEHVLAQQYVEYYQKLFKYPYINSASFFMLSSQDPTWDFFSWRSEDGRSKPIVQAVGQMNRPELVSPQTVIQPVGIGPAITAATAITIGGSQGLPEIEVIDITTSLARSSTSRYPNRSLSQINQIIIHHTAVSEKVGPQRIAKLQVERSNKPGITYHYFIAGDGTVYQTNKLTTLSDHTQGHNENSLAVCFAGNFTTEAPNQTQLKAGGTLCASLMVRLNISPTNVKGATELIATQSPGKQWLGGRRWKNLLFTEINQARGAAPITTPVVTTPTTITTPATNGRITQLNTQIAQLTAQLAQAQTTNETSQGRIAQLEAELTRVRQAAQSEASSQAKIETLNSRIAQLEAELTEARKAAASRPTAGPISPPPSKDITNSLPRHSTLTYPSRPVSTINMIVIHHTAVPASVTPERIAKVQVDKNRPGITYHYYIDGNGNILQTNKITTATRHTNGYNDNSIAVAFAGDFTAVTPTAGQLQSGAELLAYLQQQYNISTNNIQGASELINTQSPGRQWLSGQKWKNQLLARLQTVTAGQPAVSVSTPSDIDQDSEIAALKERIAMLELQLSIAQEAATGAADAPTSAPTLPPERAISPPSMTNIVNQLSRHPTNRYSSRSVSSIKTIVVHHTAVPASISAERIASFNVSKNDWPGVGFHYFITAEGTIQQTNDLTTVSYHAGGENPISVGVSFAGDFNNAVPTESQIEEGAHLIAWLLDSLNLPLTAVKGHKELTDTPCPGSQWDEGQMWQNDLNQAIQAKLAGTGERPVSQGEKTIEHYMLFQREEDLSSAANYISTFQPNVGFNIEEAKRARYVTVVGSPMNISSADEARLRTAGSQVERIPGNTAQAIGALLDNLARTNRRFLTLVD